MITTAHFLTGLAIAQAAPEAAAPAALAAVTSHFVLDAVPHRDTVGGHRLNVPNMILTVIDLVTALSLWWWLVPESHRWYAFTIGMFANLPDIFEIPGVFWPHWNKLPMIKQYHHWHTTVLQYVREPKSWYIGLLPQVIIIGWLTWYLAK